MLFADSYRFAYNCEMVVTNHQTFTSASSIFALCPDKKDAQEHAHIQLQPLDGSLDRLGRYSEDCRVRRMTHDKPLKAIMCKSFDVVFAKTRNKIPYTKLDVERSKPST